MKKVGPYESLSTIIPAPLPPEIGPEVQDPFQTQTHRRERIFRAMLEHLAGNPNATFSADDLYKVYRNYVNTLLLHDLDRQHKALHEGEWVAIQRKNEDLAGEFSYAVLRLVSKEDIEKLSQATVCMTDNFDEFMSQPEDTIKRAAARGRLYRIKQKADGKYKFTFLVRRTQTTQTSTDALEILSLLSVIELARRRIKNTPLKSKTVVEDGVEKKKSVYKDAFAVVTGRAWSSKEVKEWAQGEGITLVSSELGLRDYQSALQLKDTVHYTIVQQIKEEFNKRGLNPDATILGNDFALPILAATGIFTDDEIKIMQNDLDINDPLAALNGTIKIEKLEYSQQDIVRRYGYLQFLNRYTGTNPLYIELKARMLRVTNSLKISLFGAIATPIADPIDFYDFTNLEQKYINQIPDKIIRNLLQDAKNKNFKALNFCYPLGDNTYGLVKAIHEVLGITSIGFFGKVGATIDYLDGGYRGVKVGRIVMPERTAKNSPIVTVETFVNGLITSDVLIIPASDATEIILQVNAVTLQSLEDIRYLRQQLLDKRILILDEHGHAINPKKIRILLDMESHHLHSACVELDIIPIVCYYTSDNTKVPPVELEQSHRETIVTTLGRRGSFAILISAATVLRGLLESVVR